MNDQAEVIAAVQTANQEKLAALLAKDASLASARDDKGVSAIMHALYQRRSELLKSLLAANPTLDIFEASALGRLDRVAGLLKNDPGLAKSWSSDGFTALHFACFFAHDATGLLLLEHGADAAAVARNPMKVMPLHSAASARNLAMAKALLEHGAPVNARQAMGWTPLHAAAQNGDQPMTELLLKHRADPRMTNDEGVSAIDLANKGGFGNIVGVLEN